MEESEQSTYQKREINGDDLLDYHSTHTKITTYNVVTKLDVKASYLPQAKVLRYINCDFQEEVFICAHPDITALHFIGCTFKKRLVILNSSFEVLKLNQNTFCHHFALKQVKSDLIEIQDCKIECNKELRLHEFKAQKFVFKNNRSINDIHIKPLYVDRVWMEGSEDKYRLTFSGPTNQIVNEVRLFSYSNLRTDFEFIYLQTNTLHIIGELKDSLILIKNTKVKIGIVDYFFNEGSMKIFKLQPLDDQAYLILKNSAFGKTQVINTDFSKFHSVTLHDSSFIEVVPVNVVLCDQQNLKADTNFTAKENFRQLKIVSQKSENLDDKLKYAKLEMNTLLSIAKATKGRFADRFILSTSKLSNDFGNSWGKALIWLLSTSLIWYTLIKLMLGYTNFDLSILADEAGRFLVFINPIHQFDKLFNIDPNSQNTNGAILIDSLARILNAYLLYQFVNAFRKFAKN